VALADWSEFKIFLALDILPSCQKYCQFALSVVHWKKRYL